MKCLKCGIELSEKVCKIHTSQCEVKIEVVKEIEPEGIKEESEIVKEEIKPSEELEIKPEEYTLEQLLQMCIDNDNIKHSPSTIKRWKEERCLKELNL